MITKNQRHLEMVIRRRAKKKPWLAEQPGRWKEVGSAYWRKALRIC
jgi:hypothetical protein